MAPIVLLGKNTSMPSKADLERSAPGYHIFEFGSARDDELAEVEVAFGASAPEPIRDLLSRAPRLKWLHISAADMSRVLIPELVARTDVTITNNSGSYDLPIAGFVIRGIQAFA